MGGVAMEVVAMVAAAMVVAVMVVAVMESRTAKRPGSQPN